MIVIFIKSKQKVKLRIILSWIPSNSRRTQLGFPNSYAKKYQDFQTAIEKIMLKFHHWWILSAYELIKSSQHLPCLIFPQLIFNTRWTPFVSRNSTDGFSHQIPGLIWSLISQQVQHWYRTHDLIWQSLKLCDSFPYRMSHQLRLDTGLDGSLGIWHLKNDKGESLMLFCVCKPSGTGGL